MKKLAALMLAVVAAVAVRAETEGTIKLEDDGSTLNARLQPSVKSPRMMRLKNGTKVTIISRCGKDGNWLEIAVPPDAPVYVDEIYVVGGKARRDLKMYSDKGRDFPVWGELKKGEEVTLTDDRKYGWVRIAPPERLRLYVVAAFVDGADALEKSEAKSETKPETKPEAKPAVKPESKPEVKPEAKPEVKPEAKPEAKPAAKSEKKPETKPAAKPEKKLAPAKPDDALLELKIKKTDKGKSVKFTGTLCEATGKVKAARFLLLDEREEYLCFVYYPGKEAELKKLRDKKLTVRGTAFNVPGWKTPIVQVQKLDPIK